MEAKLEHATCFISYCHDDVDRESLKAVVETIESFSQGYIRVLVDIDLLCGVSLKEFMDQLCVADAIIVLMTPAYRDRILNRKLKTGAFEEYMKIVNLINDIDSDRNLSRRVVKPILFSGTIDNACLPGFEDILCEDLTQYRAVSDGRGGVKIPKSVKDRYSKFFYSFCSCVSAATIQRSRIFRKEYDKLLDVLFDIRKHETLATKSGLEKSLRQSIVVKTISYNNIKDQRSYILVGRKGSGKSTIVDSIYLNDREIYYSPIRINVDKFQLELLYSVIRIDQINSDVNFLSSSEAIFSYIWLSFIIICSGYIYVKEDVLGSASSELITKFYVDLMGREMYNEVMSVNIDDEVTRESCHQKLFARVFEWVSVETFHVIEKIIVNSRDGRESDFVFDVMSAISDPKRFISLLIGDDVLSYISMVSSKSKRNLLFSIDGFDSEFEKFRQNTRHMPASQKRGDFEIGFLSGAIKTVMKIREEYQWSPIFEILHFCIMVPHDRFLQIRRETRDAYLYRSRYKDLRWTGVELAIMLRKRLEVLNNIDTSDEKDPFERLEETISHCYPDIPLKTETTVSGSVYKHPIFVDILRHTFWRPRDILYYFARIITMARGFKKRGIELTEFAIDKCVADTAQQVIMDEFIGEFQFMCSNFEQIIGSFAKMSQIISYDDVISAIGGIEYQIYSCESEYGSGPDAVFNKIKFLFEIGFLGLLVDIQTYNRYQLLSREAFCFTVDERTARQLLRPTEMPIYRYVIHPIFYRYLDLMPSGSQLILDIDYEFMKKNEVLAFSASS